MTGSDVDVNFHVRTEQSTDLLMHHLAASFPRRFRDVGADAEIELGRNDRQRRHDGDDSPDAAHLGQQCTASDRAVRLLTAVRCDKNG